MQLLPWGPGGAQWLDDTDMADAYETRVRSLRRLIKLYDAELTNLDARIAAEFKGHVVSPPSWATSPASSQRSMCAHGRA